MFAYKPTPTGQAFMDSTKFIKLIMGPVGGGKSTVALFDLLKRASLQAPFKGVRRTKFIILRNTMQQLKSTVKPLIDQWLVTMPSSPLGQWRLTDNTFEMMLRNSTDGTLIHTEFLMMAADTPDDVRRLLSVECSAAWVEEAREVDPEVFSGLQGRVARFPSRAAGGVTYPGVICSTNPPPVGGFWHGMISKPPENAEVFIQPAAILDDGSINPKAENLNNLDASYYDNLLAGKTEDWINVYLKNQFGAGDLGQPIYRASFKRSFHVATSELNAVPGSLHPLIVGMDNGLQAAAAIGQQDMRGRVNILAEAFVPEDQTMGVESFLDKILLPLLSSRFPTFPRDKIAFVLDPACFTRSQVDEKTIAMAVQQRGFAPIKASTNDPERRVQAVEGLLTRQIDGAAGLLVDPRCRHITDTLEWGHRWKKTTSGLTSTTAEKNHHSHCFVAGTMVATPEGPVRIEQMTCDHKVLTPLGVADVAAVMSHLSNDLYELEFSDGARVTCTGDHPFFTARGVVLANALEYNEVLFSLGEERCQKPSTRSKGSSTSSTTTSPRATTSPIGPSMVGSTCTGSYGSTTTGLFPRGTMFTTSTATRLTTALKTSNAWRGASTLADTVSSAMRPRMASRPLWRLWRWLERALRSGTALTPVGVGIASTADGPGWGGAASSCNAHNATSRTLGSPRWRDAAFAPCLAKERPAEPPVSMTSSEPAASAARAFEPTSTPRQKPAVRLVGKQHLVGQSAKVYDLTVSGEHCFYANGVLVSNCGDAVQYLALHYNMQTPGQGWLQKTKARPVVARPYVYA